MFPGSRVLDLPAIELTLKAVGGKGRNVDSGHGSPPGYDDRVDERRAAAELRAWEAALRDVAEEIRQDRERSPRRREEPRFRRVLTVLFVLATAALSVANFAGYGLVNRRGPAPTIQEQERLVRGFVGFQVREIDLYVQREGRLPGGLAALDLPLDGSWEYEPVGREHFRLRMRHGKITITFDSGRDRESFFEEAPPAGGRGLRS